jgi:hypothetical protein
VILIDETGYNLLTPNHFLQIQDCGVIIHYIGFWNYPSLPVFSRIPVAQYIFKQQQNIDRVLFCDGFDVVFQGDPFTKYFTREKLFLLPRKDQYTFNLKYL